MKVELTGAEVKLIEEAMDVWEKEPHASGMVGMMMGSMLSSLGDGDKEQRARERAKMVEEERKKSQDEAMRRRRVSTLLRAKLYQAEASLSEHEVDKVSAFPGPETFHP